MLLPQRRVGSGCGGGGRSRKGKKVVYGLPGVNAGELRRQGGGL